MKSRFEIDQQDLRILYLHTKGCYGDKSFNSWLEHCKASYNKYAMSTTYAKTFSQWVNGQIIALT